MGQGKKFVAAACDSVSYLSTGGTHLSHPQLSMHKILNSAVLSVVLATPVLAQAKPTASATAPIPLTATLPVDPKVKIGTLPNGIRYYIRQNLKPEKRAELRLVVNAGSILETDDQLGLAHFVEHTAFNGTTHFAKNDLVNYLAVDRRAVRRRPERLHGLRRDGLHPPVPTDTARIVEQAFTILEDWAHGQMFDSTEVVNERGVVREEWRRARARASACCSSGCRSRSRARATPSACRSATSRASCRRRRRELRAFYANWYRPDLMAVVAVGDFDPAQIEAQIKKHFSGIPKPANRAQAHDVRRSGEQGAARRDRDRQGSDELRASNVMFKLPAEKTQDRRRLPPRPDASGSTSACSTPLRRDRAEARRAVPRRRRIEGQLLRAQHRRRSRSAPA